MYTKHARKKNIHPKNAYSVNLQELVPENNFYRRLLSALDLHWLYKETTEYYGTEGQESIDPVVFFKICTVGYINNIASDRKLIEFCEDSFVYFWGIIISMNHYPGIQLSAEQDEALKKLLLLNRKYQLTRNFVEFFSFMLCNSDPGCVLRFQVG
jgi:transposase